jgi:hypothetical protein
VLLVEPGELRTSFIDLTTAGPTFIAPSEPYTNTAADQLLKFLLSTNGKQDGDPEKAAQRIVEVVLGTGMASNVGKYLRLPLTKQTGVAIRAKIGLLEETINALEPIWSSVDFK